MDQVFARELDALKGEGFLRSGLGVLLTALESKNKRQRALAAQRLGWMREPAAVEALLAAGLKASEEASTLVDALGELGDERAIAFCRTAASKKLLSRRRSGVEALRKLGDAAGLADAKNVALERLPQAVRAALAAREEGDASPANVAPLVDVVAKTPQKGPRPRHRHPLRDGVALVRRRRARAVVRDTRSTRPTCGGTPEHLQALDAPPRH